MYIVFFLLWIIFNGKITTEIVLFGLAIAAVMYAFICKFMDYSVKKDLVIGRESIYILYYMLVLIVEIVKANLTVCRMILSSRYEIEPAIIKFRTNLRSRTARVVLANSITLTPVTITVTLEDDAYVVHCLDKSLAEGIDTSVFVKLLERMEASVYEQ